MHKGFTLLELIIVIVILGILATLGFTQYTRMVEKGRTAEAKSVIGLVIKNAIAYRLQNGTVTGMSKSDVGMSANPGDVPTSCVSTHYYNYDLTATDPTVVVYAWRCSNGAGGKPPGASPTYGITAAVNLVTGVITWGGDAPYY